MSDSLVTATFYLGGDWWWFGFSVADLVFAGVMGVLGTLGVLALSRVRCMATANSSESSWPSRSMSERFHTWRSVSTGKPDRSRIGRTPMPLTCQVMRACSVHY